MSSEEKSKSGSPIYRHTERKIPFTPTSGDSSRIQAISEHAEKYIGKVDVVLHELVSDLVHIDVHRINPTPERNYYTLFTTGMSEVPMTVPEGAEALRYAELVLSLPPDWPMPAQPTDWDETGYWPIRLLKVLARLPHEFDTWLGQGHSVPNQSAEGEPYAENTKLCCALLFHPIHLPDEFATLQISPDVQVRFYTILPLYREEMQFKLDHGLEALIDRFDQQGVSAILDPRRKNVCRKRFWFF